MALRIALRSRYGPESRYPKGKRPTMSASIRVRFSFGIQPNWFQSQNMKHNQTVAASTDPLICYQALVVPRVFLHGRSLSCSYAVRQSLLIPGAALSQPNRPLAHIQQASQAINKVAFRRSPHNPTFPQRPNLRLRQPHLAQHRVGILPQSGCIAPLTAGSN